MDFDPTTAKPVQTDEAAAFDPSTAMPARALNASSEPEQKSGLVRRVLGDTAVDVGRGIIGAGEAAVGLADIPTFGRAGRGLESIGYRPKETKDIIGDFYSPERKAAQAKVDQAEGFIDTAAAMLSNPSTIAGAAVESVPLMVGGGAIAQGLKRVAPLARTLGTIGRAAVGEGAVGAGAAAESIRQQSEDGVLSPMQVAAAIGSGAGTSVIGAAGGTLARRLGIADPDVLLAGGDLGAGDASQGLARRTLTGLAKGAAAEGVFEEMPQSAQEQAWQNLATDRPLGEGVGESAAAGLLAGAAMGGPVGAISGTRTATARTDAAPDTSRVTRTLMPDGTPLPDPANGPLSRAVNIGQSTGALQAAADQQQAQVLDAAAQQGFKDAGKAKPGKDGAAVEPTINVGPEAQQWTFDQIRAYLGAQVARGPLPKPETIAQVFGLKQRAAGELRRSVLADQKRLTEDVAELDSVTLPAEGTRDAQPTGRPDTGAADGPGAVGAGGDRVGAAALQDGAAGAPGNAARGAGVAAAPQAADTAAVAGGQDAGSLTGISSRAAPRAAARTEGGRAVPADGGFVVRTARSVESNVPRDDLAPAPSPSARSSVPASASAPPTSGPAEASESAAASPPTAPHDPSSRLPAPGAAPADPDTGQGNPTAEGQVVAQPQATPAASAVQAAAEQAATSPTNGTPVPTQAQKEAGNYAKGHVRIAGHDISIENPRGSKRDPKWKPLAHHYGYIRGTVGRDKDHVDVFLTDGAEDTTRPVFVVDQVNKDGSFDEHKVVLGTTNEAEARKAYLDNYDKGWTGLGGITQMSQEQFKSWVRDPVKTKRRITRAAAPAAAGKTYGLGRVVRKNDAVIALRREAGMTAKQAEAAFTAIERDGLKEGTRNRARVVAAIEAARAAPKQNPKPRQERTRAVKTDAARKPMDLLRVIARGRGLNREAFRAQGVDPAEFTRRAGFQFIFRKKGGMTLSDLREFMQQESYLPRDPEDGRPVVDDNDAFDLFDRALRSGDPIYADDQAADVAKYRDQQQEEVEPDGATGFQTDAEAEAAFRAEQAAAIARLEDRAYDLGASDADIVAAAFDASNDEQRRQALDTIVARLEQSAVRSKAENRGGDRIGGASVSAQSESRSRPAVERGDGTEDRGDGVDTATPPEAASGTGGEVNQTSPPQSGLFAAPTAREQVDAARRDRDADRDGRAGTGRTDMAAGDGELFAGDRPEQSQLSRPDRSLTGALHALKAGRRNQPLPSPEARRIATAVLAKWKAAPRLVMLDKDPGGAAAGVEGWYDPATSTVTLVAPNIRGGYDPVLKRQVSTAERIRMVTVHESIGHAGIEAITGPALWGQLGQTIDSMRASGKHDELFRQIDRRNPGEDRATLIREAIAVMAEKGVRNSVIDRVIAAVRRFLRDTMGLSVKFGESELRQHIVAAARYVQQGDAAAGSPTAEGAFASRPLLDLKKEVPVTNALPGMFGDTSTQERRRAAQRLAFAYLERLRKAGRTFTNEDTGWKIGLSHSSVREIVSWSADPNVIHLIAALPRLTKVAVLANSEVNNEIVTVNESVRAYHTLYAPVALGGELRMARIVVREHVNGRFAYDLQASDILKTANPAEAGSVVGDTARFPAPKAGARQNLPTNMTVAQIRDAVNAVDRPGWFMSQRAGAFYSAMSEAIGLGKGAPKKADAAAWKGWLDGAQRRGEFKQGERDWLGVDAWLQGRGSTTREELAAFVRSNQVQVQDVMLVPSGQVGLPDGWSAKSVEGGWEVVDRDGEVRGMGETRIAAIEDAQDPDAVADGEGGVVKFEKHTLPGGKNYRELLLTMPSKTPSNPVAFEFPSQQAAEEYLNDVSAAGFEELDYSVDKNSARVVRWASTPPFRALQLVTENRGRTIEGETVDNNVFVSSHFDQPNILAHVRFNERTDTDGKRVLFIEEIQSDWHQQGRKVGYKDAAAEEEAERLVAEATASFDKWQAENPTGNASVWRAANPDFVAAIQKADNLGKGGVPDAPFKGTDEWAMLAFKRMVRHAAENGFDRIGWTTGAQQAARYDLSKQVDQLLYAKNADGTYYVSAITGSRGTPLGESLTEDKIEDFVGKDVAKRIANGEGVDTQVQGDRGTMKSLSGDGLKVGGEGMAAFYDKILPAAVNKWAKRFDGKATNTAIESNTKAPRDLGSADVEAVTAFHDISGRFWNGLSRQEQNNLTREYLNARGALETVSVHSLDLTDTMRDAALQGLPLFSRPDVNDGRVHIAGRVGTFLDKVGTGSRNPIPDRFDAAQRVAAEKFVTFEPGKSLGQRAREIRENAAARFTQKVIDQFRPLRALNETAFMQAHMSKGTDGALEAAFNHGIPVWHQGAFIVRERKGGFRKVMSDLNGEHDQFLMWVVGNRAEGLRAEGREQLFSEDDIAAMKRLNQGNMADGSNRKAAYSRALAELGRYNKAFLDIAQGSGLIDAEARKVWEDGFYIPFYREMDRDPNAGPGQVKGLLRQRVIERLVGGVDPLGDPLENILANWSQMLTSGMKNRAANAALDSAIKMKIVTKVDGPQKGAVWTMRDGKESYYLVHDPMVLEALESLSFNGYDNPVMRAAGKFKRVLTTGVTINPSFRIRNMARDVLSAMATSDVSFNPLRNIVDGLRATAKDSDTNIALMSGGGAVRFGAINDGDQASHAKRLISMGVQDHQILDTTDKVKNAFRRFYDWWGEVGDRSETVNRAVIYQRALAQGKSHLEASFAARDLLNFTSMGSASAIRALTQVLPFFNARLQGTDRLIRGAKADPRRFAAVAGSLAMASALLYLLNADDDDYKNLPDYVRDNYWPIKLGGKWVYVPKPFEIGAMASIVERGTELATAGDDYQARDFGATLTSLLSGQLAMNPIPQIARPVTEAAFNYDLFRMAPIDSMGQQQLAPEDRFTARTSAGAVAAGKVTGISPQRLEHLVSGYFGWLGIQALNVSDYMMRDAMGLPSNPRRDLSRPGNLFVVGDFVKDPSAVSSKYVTRFYDSQHKIDQLYASANLARKTGDAERDAELRSDPSLRNRILYRNADRQISRINQQIKTVSNNRELSPAEKNDRIERLNQRRADIARRIDARARQN